MGRLKQIIESAETPGGRRFDAFIQALIVLSLISFSIETLPNLSARSRLVLGWIEVGTVAAFSIEYLLRVALADKKLRFVFSFFGLVDLLAILPFYVARGVDLRSLRAFRLLRLFRAMKLARYRQGGLRSPTKDLRAWAMDARKGAPSAHTWRALPSPASRLRIACVLESSQRPQIQDI